MNKLIDTIKSKKVKTPIGVLPYDWKVEKLGKFIKIYSGESPSKIKFKGEGIPYYKVDDLNQFDKYMGKSKLIADSHSIKKTVPKNSLIFPKRGAAILTNKVRILTQESYFDTNIMGVEVKEDEINLEFLYYYIVKRGLYKIADTSTIPQLNNKHIEPLLFPKPELKEQKKISEVLSTWDKAIELKEKLIEQKKQQKKGLMQKLLTGEVRLPGCSSEVQRIRLKGLVKEIKQRNRDNKVTRILSVTNSKGFIDQSDQFDRQVASEDISSYKVVKKGQFAYNPSRVNVGSIDLLRQFDDGVLSPMYVIFETKADKLLPEYLYHFIKSNLFLNQLGNFLQGSVRQSLSFDGLEQIKLFIPSSLNEQKQIANILSLLDKEIYLLEMELKELCNQKKGLMQLLLTGKVRVKV